MPKTVDAAVSRQLVKYEEHAKAIASRQHIDLQELRYATKYVGRNIERLNDDVKAGLDAITLQEERIVDRLERVGLSLGQLVEVTSMGFRITIAQLNQISWQLQQILQVLNYPARTQGAEQREKGIYLTAKGKTQLAVTSLQKAVELNECDFISLYSLGFIFAANGQYKAAAACFADSALFADPNPAMSADAAILAAYCYRKIEERGKAWAVLRRTLERNCPDLALPLSQYATSKTEQAFATKLLSHAFVIDAELAITAETMELTGIEEAANTAYGELADQILALKRAWKQLYDVGEAAGLPYAHPIPKQPKTGKSSRSLLLNAAIYRRNLQQAIIELKTALLNRLSSPLPIADLPTEPYHDTEYTHVRLGWSLVPGILAWIFFANHNVVWGIISVLAVVAIMWVDIQRQYEHSQAMKVCRQEKFATDKANTTARKKNERVSEHREEIQLAVDEAEKVLAATIPPPVPRAFSEDLISYTQR